MYYGAGSKGLLWKLGCVGGFIGILGVVMGIVSKEFPLWQGMVIFILFAGGGFLLTLPFGIRGTTMTERTGGGGIVGVITNNWFLLLTIGVFYYGVKLIIWVGDLLYSTVWKGIDLARGRKYEYSDDEVYV